MQVSTRTRVVSKRSEIEHRGTTAYASRAQMRSTHVVHQRTSLYNERMQRARSSRRLPSTSAPSTSTPSKCDYDVEAATDAVEVEEIDTTIADEEEDDAESDQSSQNCPSEAHDGHGKKWYDLDGNEVRPKQVVRFVWGNRHYDIVWRKMKTIRRQPTIECANPR